jgi:Cft2 family RNA processing exonuclease
VLKIKDRDGKTVSRGFTVTAPKDYLRFRITAQRAGNQPGGGAIVIQAFGGKEPYSYQLNNEPPLDNGIFTGLNSGIYTLSIRDSNGCTISRKVEVK